MNLKTYFNQLSEEKLSDERKIALYQRICEERANIPQSLARTKILRKRVIYSLLSFILISSFF
ncbi:hypothetical protein IJU97_00010 [bacterium]|nr:hypothetical protein [bacterium]